MAASCHRRYAYWLTELLLSGGSSSTVLDALLTRTRVGALASSDAN